MSADSVSSVASAPYPTTPADLSSIEMDRFSNGWARLDINVKGNQELHELDHPWKKMDIGRRGSGQPQEYFCQVRSRFKEVLVSRWHLQTLRVAMDLAERLIFCHKGKKIAGYYKSAWAKMKMMELEGANYWTIIFQDRVGQGQFVRYTQTVNHEIYLDFPLVDRAARAGYYAEQNPTAENHMIYTRHIFMIGIILGRVFFQSLTDIINNQLGIMSGRGGTIPEMPDWEYLILGGHLVGCSKVASNNDPILDLLVLQVKAVTNGIRTHFTASDRDISNIVWNIENWEKLLPLTPTEAGIVKNSPNNMTFQMKGIDWSGKQISFNQGYINRVIPASDQDEDEEATQAPPSPTSVLSTASL